VKVFCHTCKPNYY